jgi:hypothetical protein
MHILAPGAVERTYESAAEALDLVLAVAHPTRPRPFLLSANNAHAGTLDSVAEAHASGLAYVVTVAPDVLAFDLDSAALVMAGNALYAELTGESWPSLRTNSGRCNHGHLWAVVPDADDRARITERATALGLPLPRDTMRPPGAPHRNGMPVEVLDDISDFVDAVTVARTPLAATDTDRFDWRHVLTTGRWPSGWTGTDRTGSAKVWWICIGAIRAGHHLDDVRALLSDPDNRGGAAYRGKLGRSGKRHADHWLTNHVWPKAVKAAAVQVAPPADAMEARERLSAFADALNAHPWTGKAGTTDRAVLSALAARGYARGSVTPTMSLRELAQAAPCSLRTVQRSVSRLADSGWLQVADRGRGRTVVDEEDGSYREQAHATRWRLLVLARTDHTGGTPPPRTSLSVVSTREPVSALRATADVCRWGGLGLNVPRILDALVLGPMTAARLAELLNLNRGNLRYRLLPRLAALGLVVRTADGWERVADLDAAMEAAAEALELTGKASEVVAEHAADRAAYLDHRERLRGRREQAKAAAIAVAVAARRSRALVLPGLSAEPPFTIASKPLQDVPRSTVPERELGKRGEATYVSAGHSDTKRGTDGSTAPRDVDAPPPMPPPTPLEALCAPLVAAGGPGG